MDLLMFTLKHSNDFAEVASLELSLNNMSSPQKIFHQHTVVFSFSFYKIATPFVGIDMSDGRGSLIVSKFHTDF